MLIVGLTGGIGAGKSTAAARFEAKGADVIDVDAIGREVADVGGRVHERVLAQFGRHLVKDGRLDRPALAAIVFNDPVKLAELTAISHPAINDEIRERCAKAPARSIVILDMAILVESAVGRWGERPEDGYQVVVTVEAPLEVRIARLVEQRGMSEADARARVANQASDADRRRVAHYVIDNSGGPDDLALEIDRVWAELETKRG